MPILDSLFNNKGIQNLNTQIANGQEGAGKGAFLRHTNGKLYLVYAVSDVQSGIANGRRLFFTVSVDGGRNWAPRLALLPYVNGQWDDCPCLIQIDTTDINSDIGIVFNRFGAFNAFDNSYAGTSVYRFTCDIYGNQTYPCDQINNLSGRVWDIETYGSGGFVLALYDQQSQINLQINPTGFYTSNWSVAQGVIYGVDADNPNGFQVFGSHVSAIRLKRLVNGDYALCAIMDTLLNGTTGSPADLGTARTDVYVSVSQDNLQDWTTPQNITSYTGTPVFDLNGIAAASDVSIEQLSTGEISLLFSEYTAFQVLSPNTTPPFPPGFGDIQGDSGVFSVGTDYLMVGKDSIYAYRLSDGLIRRFYTSSVINPIWSDNILGFATSPDGRFVVARTDSSLEIFDTLGTTDPDNWTLLSLRSTTTPATYGQASVLLFLDDTRLLVGWANSGVGRCYASIIDCSLPSDGFTDCLSGAGDAIQGMVDGSLVTLLPMSVTSGGITETHQILRFPQGTRWYHTDITQQFNLLGDGSFDTSLNYSTDIGVSNAFFGAYDNINDEHILCSSGGVRVRDRAGSFAADILDPTAGQFAPTPTSPIGFANGGMLMLSNNYATTGSNSHLCFYSYGSRQYLGIAEFDKEFPLSLPFFGTAIGVGTNMKQLALTPDGNFMLGLDSGVLRAVSVQAMGRLRTGIFSYDAGTGQLITSGVNIYDAANFAKLGASQANYLQNIHHSRDSSDNLVVYGYELALTNTTRSLGPFTAIIDANAALLSIGAKIRNVELNTVSIKTHMAGKSTPTLSVKAQIVAAYCIKIKASIIPKQNDTISIGASIRNGKRSSFTGSFRIQNSFRTAVRATYYATTGSYARQTMGIGAYISRKTKKRFTGHFIVRSGATTLFGSSSSTVTNQKQIGMKAFIN